MPEKLTCPNCDQDNVTLTDHGTVYELRCAVCDWHDFEHPERPRKRYRAPKPQQRGNAFGKHYRPSEGP